MADVRAADLPEGSIVADRTEACIKVGYPSRASAPWDETGSNLDYTNEYVDSMLAAGAKVLRHGYGEES